MQRKETRWLKLIALVAALTLAFAACGEEETPPAGGDGDDEAPTEFMLVSEGHLTIGSDIPYPPFEFEDASGNLTGFDVDIVREVASRIGLENTDDDWLSVNFNTIFQQQASGTKFDIIAAAVTAYAPEGSPAGEVVAERGEIVDFSLPVYPSLQSLTVDTEANPDVAMADELPDGARIAVQRATTGAFYAEQELEPMGFTLVQFPKAPPMYQALQGGSVDAIFNDLPVSLEEIKDTPNLQVVEQVDTGEQYAFGVSKENTALLEAINAALEEMFDDGTYATIYKKYFPEQELPEYASE